MALKTLEDALVEGMEDLVSAESQIAEALPKMATKATNKELKTAFRDHLKQTKGHSRRLKEAFKLMGKKPQSKLCEAAKGLVEEGKSVMEEDAEPDVMDAMLINAAQKVEHYEIASYGTLCTWAKLLGLKEVHAVLAETLNEEEQTDKNLTKLAKKSINKNAINKKA